MDLEPFQLGNEFINREAHKIAILDIRIINCDRNE
jgi:hypothetical protein